MSSRMMNVVAVFLVLSSLVAAGFWSPTPDHRTVQDGENVLVKEGHRVVVVEYDPDNHDGNTKVVISPHDQTQLSQKEKEKLSTVTDNVKGKAKETFRDAKGKAKEVFDEAKEKASEAASVLPNLGQGVSSPNGPTGQGPRELVCDAFGKCKHKITNAFGKAKETSSEATHKMKEKAHQIEEQAKGKASEALGKTKATISHKTGEISSRAHEAKEAVEEKVKEAVEKSKTMKKDVSDKIEEARQKGGRGLGKIRDFGKHVYVYINLPKLVSSTMSVVHLLGFSTAYGMCVWVTFISSYALAGALPRQQFGIVQSKVFPVYFRLLGYSMMVALIGHLYGERRYLLSTTIGMAQAYSLLLAFAVNSFNYLYLEPRATKVMYKRMKMEKEEDQGRTSEQTHKPGNKHETVMSAPPAAAAAGKMPTPSHTTSEINQLGERLKRLNAYSSFLNISVLMVLTWHLGYLGLRIP